LLLVKSDHRLPPNTPIQPTPLRSPKIGAILKAGFGSTAFPTYRGGAADGQAVGPPITFFAYVYL
jgi:hypothetical protein